MAVLVWKWLPSVDSHHGLLIQGQASYCWTTREWWAAGVMLPVQPVKSRMLHFESLRSEVVLAAGFAPALAAFSTPCLCYVGLREQNVAPVAGLAPGLRPHLGLNGYKPFVLLYTTGGEKWHCAFYRNCSHWLHKPNDHTRKATKTPTNSGRISQL